MTNAEMLKEMLSMQEEYDQMVFEAHGMKNGYRDLRPDQIYLALIDEVGELNHELKADWCWWKNTQKPVDREKVLEELADVVHFILMEVLYQESRNDFAYDPVESFIDGFELQAKLEDEMLVNGFITLISTSVPSFRGAAIWMIASACGFTWQEVHEAYKAKNAGNRQRVKDE